MPIKHRQRKWKKQQKTLQEKMEIVYQIRDKKLTEKNMELVARNRELERDLREEKEKTIELVRSLQLAHPIVTMSTQYPWQTVFIAKTANGAWATNLTVSEEEIRMARVGVEFFKQKLMLRYWQDLMSEAAKMAQHREPWFRVTHQEARDPYHIFDSEGVRHVDDRQYPTPTIHKLSFSDMLGEVKPPDAAIFRKEPLNEPKG